VKEWDEKLNDIELAKKECKLEKYLLQAYASFQGKGSGLSIFAGCELIGIITSTFKGTCNIKEN